MTGYIVVLTSTYHLEGVLSVHYTEESAEKFVEEYNTAHATYYEGAELYEHNPVTIFEE